MQESIFHRKAPTDLQRESDHERLVKAFAVPDETIERTKCGAGQNRGGKQDLLARSVTTLWAPWTRPLEMPCGAQLTWKPLRFG